MRELTENTAAEAARQTGSYPIRILQMELPGSSSVLYLSDRVASPTSGLETLAVVKSWGDLRLEPEIGQVGGYGSFSLTVADLDWLLFDAETQQPGLQYANCTLYLWFSGTEWSDRLTLFSGSMAPQDFQIGRGEVNLTIRGLEELWNKDIGFRITQDLFPTIKCSECDGTILPLIFGRPAYRIPLCPIVQPARSTLNLPLNICDSMLQIAEDADLLGFPVGEEYPIQLVVGANGDYDILSGYFDDVTKNVFHITDRLSYFAHGETAGVYVVGGLTWVTIEKDDLDDPDRDMRGYPIIFPQRVASGAPTCTTAVLQFWDETSDPTELAVWADNHNEFPTSDDDGFEYIILNRLTVPFYQAGTAVVQVGEWVWAANFLPSEAIDRVEVKAMQNGVPVFFTVNPYQYEVDTDNRDFNVSHLGRTEDDPGLTTIIMQTSPIEEGFPDDIMYVTIRGVKHIDSSPAHNPLADDLVDGEAIDNPAAVIAEIASHPLLGDISDFQLEELQDAFDQMPIVFAFGILEQRGLWEVIGDLAKQSGLLAFVDSGKLVVRRVRREAESGDGSWTSGNENRHKASQSMKPLDVKEMPIELIGKYRPSGGDDERVIVRRSTSTLEEVARLTSAEMDFWAIQAPSNVAYMTEWWLLHQMTRNRRFTFEMFMEYLAAQPGDGVYLTHDVVNDVPEDERHVDTWGRIVAVTHVAGHANGGKMELIRVTIECHEWEVSLYQGSEPYECGVMRSTSDEPPPTVYTIIQNGGGGSGVSAAPTFPNTAVTPTTITNITGEGTSGLLFGKTDEALLKGNTRTVSRYTDDATDTGIDDEVKNHFEDIDTGRWVWYTEIAEGVFYIVRAES